MSSKQEPRAVGMRPPANAAGRRLAAGSKCDAGEGGGA